MKSKLFLASCVALTVTSITFALRAKLESVFSTTYGLSATDIGVAFAPAFWGFTISMIVGGLLIKSVGAKRFIAIMFTSHLIGIVVTIFATDFITLFIGTLFIGIGNGFVEAVCNPMVASIYPDQKVKMLNKFHVWFPLGILIGSLGAYVIIDVLQLSWQIPFVLLIILTFIYGYLFKNVTISLPEMEAMNHNVSDMLKACGKPLFLFMVLCMLLTAATELGTGQRISSLLEETGVAPLLVLAFIFGLMSLGRFYAGALVKKLKTERILLFSAIISCLGLIALSYTTGYAVFVSAAIFAIGICYFWPTMIGFVAETIPESGALGLSIMGGAGMLSVSFVLPIMGKFMDGDISGQETLRIMALLPFILIFLFIGLHVIMNKRRSK